MTVLTLDPAAPTVPRPGLRALFGAEPTFAATGLLIALSLGVTLPAMAIDPRTFDGASVWLKPVKFQIALAVYLLTLAFFARWMPAGTVARWPWRLYAAAVVGAILAEMAWIGGAAAFGVGSHFNLSTPLMARLYSLMGAFAILLTSASLVQGVLIARNRATGLPPALHLSVWLGLVLTFALTLPVASTMASMPGHLVGSPVSGAAVPFLGWSREVGDLRAPHFLATHALHVLPLAGLLAAATLPERAGRRAVWVAAALFVAAVAGAFAGALAGWPLVPLV